MNRMKLTLRETVAWALFNANPIRWQNYRVASLAQLPQQERQTLLGEADAALAALGLDDFKAAVERGAKALGWDEEMDHEPHGEQLWDEAQEVLEAALSATEEGE